MDVTFVCSGEEPFKMEVGFFDTVQDVKQKLQSRKGWPTDALPLFHNGNILADVDGGGTEQYSIVEGSVIHVALDGGQHQQRSRNKKPSKRRDDVAAPPDLEVKAPIEPPDLK